MSLFLAALIRFWNLESRALDFDEVFEVTQCADTLGNLLQLSDGMPPTFSFLLGHWNQLFGSDLAGRWLVALIGIANVAIIGVWARIVAGNRTGVLASLIAAVLPMHVYHSQSIRVYSLFCFAVTLMFVFGWRLLADPQGKTPGSTPSTMDARRPDSKRWVAFVFASWLACITHYYAAIPTAVMWMIVFFSIGNKTPKRYLGFVLLLGVLMTPLGYSFLIDLRTSEENYFQRTFFRFEDWAYTYYLLIAGYSLGPSIEELQRLSLQAGLIKMLPFAAVMVTVLLPIAYAGVRTRTQRSNVIALLILLIVPVLILGFITYWSSNGFVYRYVIWLVGPFAIFVAIGISTLRPGLYRSLSLVGVVTICLASCVNLHTHSAYRQDDFHAVKDFLSEENANLPILAMPRYFGEAVEYHLASDHPVHLATLFPGREQNWNEILPALEQDTIETNDYWILMKWYPDDHPRTMLGNQLIDRLEAKYVTKITTIVVYRANRSQIRDVVGL